MNVKKFFLLLVTLAKSIFAAIVFVFIPVVLISVISSRTSFMGLQSFTVLSGSMTPLIPVGSVVYTIPISEPAIGEIITFKRGNINVTHRIVDIVDKNGKHISTVVSPLGNSIPLDIYYRTRGDANNSDDSELVPRNKIIGNVLFHFPGIGIFSAFIKSAPGFIALIVLPTFMFIGFELWNIKGEIEKSVEQKTLKKLGAL